MIPALSMTQPWATLVAVEAKVFETRSWFTSYRGALAIHASKGFPRWAVELCFEEPFASTLRVSGIERPADLPLGAVIAVVNIDRCLKTEAVRQVIGDHERAFGDYSDG